ncbi:MAG: hypothetical protein ACRBBT_00390 [Paracoccaceae bacterium]
MADFTGAIFFLAFIGFVIWLYIMLPASMAKNRNRSPVIWVLIAIVGSPILAVLLLIAMGETTDHT